MNEHARPMFWFAVLLAIAAVVCVTALIFGAKAMTLAQALKALSSPGSGTDAIIVWTLRMPRSIAAYLAGAALAVAGYLLQSITRNPLAAPDLTGVTAGAVAFIVATFVFLPAVSSAFYPAIGMLGGLMAAALTLWAAHGGRASPLHLALAGITVALFLHAITTYVLVRGGPQSPSVLFWLSGGFQGRSWPQVTYMLPWTFVGLGGALLCHRIIELLSLGDEAAAGIGANPALWKLVLLVISICLVAGVTPIAGPVAFVGLAAPHLVRLLRPGNALWSILLNVALGGCLLMTADALARSVAAPREVPVSVFTALIGGPVFIFLTQRGPGIGGPGGRSR
ncbi:iron ABC transporter permease [Ensifer sesbaniae]|uniref:FecCD family ABC transporter permease n=1 Tax=Ensifer sesbaniae TaxID=1214071 RepID=UPI002000FD97|nr:iron ABC transporter permease [Ensifer sesbaniae]